MELCRNQTSGAGRSGCLAQLAGALGFTLAGLVAIVVFLRVFAPPRFAPPEAPVRVQDNAAMLAAMARAAVEGEVATIAGFGSRAVGQPGHAQCADYLEQRLTAAGLEVFHQEFAAIHPSGTADLRIGDGAATVPAWPLLPNHVQPMVSPEGGVRGRLFEVSEASLRTAPTFAGLIAVLDLSKPLPAEFGLNPGRYADVGFEALLVTHASGLDRIPWERAVDLRLRIPVNYVRLIASAEVLGHLGQEARIEVRQQFRRYPARNLVARLAAPGGSDRAVLVSGHYDAFTALPELAHGSQQTLQTAVQLSIMEGLGHYRQDLRRDVIFAFSANDYMGQAGILELATAVGRHGRARTRKIKLENDLATNTERMAYIGKILERFAADPQFARQAEASLAGLGTLDRPTADFFTQQYRYVLRSKVLTAQEALLQARIAFQRTGEAIESQQFQDYRRAKIHFDRVNSAASYPIGKYLADDRDSLRTALQRRFAALAEYHEQRDRRLRQALALNDLFAGYREILVVSPQLNPQRGSGEIETISISAGESIHHGDAAQEFRRLLQQAIHSLGKSGQVAIDYQSSAAHESRMLSLLAQMPIQPDVWSKLSHPAFAVVTADGEYRHYMSPLPLPAFADLKPVAGSLAVLGETVLALAHGAGNFPALRVLYATGIRGNVYAQGSAARWCLTIRSPTP
jgi:hypothetical protein